MGGGVIDTVASHSESLTKVGDIASHSESLTKVGDKTKVESKSIEPNMVLSSHVLSSGSPLVT